MGDFDKMVVLFKCRTEVGAIVTVPLGEEALPLLFEPEAEEEIQPQIDEYDLAASPNDFNVLTIYNFITAGSVKIPAFQRNYVWDIKRASRLIESIIIGLPVPQVFLYEQGRNNFLVVDGQQRLMTIFYFMRGRFPKATKRAELRQIFDKEGRIPDEVLDDSEYFDTFRLRLPDISEGTPNKFARLTYETLGDYRTTFDLRTIRNIIVKQVSPSDGDSSIFEMFNRLNTGGVLLTPQEIRASMYHSEFLTTLNSLNVDARWRALIGQAQTDNHARDIEVLLRATAMWKRGQDYKPSMTAFLNAFAQQSTSATPGDLADIHNTWDWFLQQCEGLNLSPLQGPSGKLSVAVFDAAFAAVAQRRELIGDFSIPDSYFNDLASDENFRANTEERPTDRAHVRGRVHRAAVVLGDALAEV